MPTDRRLPVHPRLEAIEAEADALRLASPTALSRDGAAKALAESYGVATWERLRQAVRLADAIWRDDIESVRTLVTTNRALLHEPVLIRRDSNWGPQ